MRRWKWLGAAALMIVACWVTYALATTYKYTWATAVVLAATNGYSGATADLANDGAYDLTGDIDLATNGYYGIFLTLNYDGSGSTDSIILSYFGSPDGSNFDTAELWSVSCPINGGNASQISWLIVPAPPHGQIGVKTSGTTNTFDYKITYVPVSGTGT